MEEMWSIIQYFPNYEVSNFGVVRRVSDKKTLATKLDNNRAICVVLYNKTVRKSMDVKKLVATAFVQNENNYKYIRHIDDNLYNNRADNLVYTNSMPKHLKYNDEELSLFKKYNVTRYKDLPLYTRYLCRYNVMHRFCREHKGITTIWDSFCQFYSDLYPVYGDKFNDNVNFRMYLPWDKKEYNLNTIAFGNKTEANRNSIATKRYTINGVSKTLKEWSKEINIREATLRDRILGYRDVLSFEDIVYSINTKSKKFTKNLTLVQEATLDNKKARRRASKAISEYKSRDAKKGLKNDLDMVWYIKNILSKPCVYCGDTVNIGCDRIHNDKGHTKDNIVPCCRECNIARGDNFTYEEFFHIGKVIKEVKSKRKEA